MSYTIWFFVYRGDEQWKKVAAKWMERFGNGGEVAPARFGGHLQVAEVVVEFLHGQPFQVVSIDYTKLPLLPDGTLDEQAKSAQMSATMELLVKDLSRSHGGAVVRAQNRFARRRHVNLTKWEPRSAEIEALRTVLRRYDLIDI